MSSSTRSRMASSCWRGRMPSTEGVWTPAATLSCKAHDANLEELVDHVGKDRDELAAFEDGKSLVLAEVQQSRTELET